MPTISSPGIGSGLDINAIVTQLMAVERQPLVSLQKQATELNTSLSTFGKLQSLASAMRDKAAALCAPGTWSQATATSSNTAAVAVSAASGATAASYSVEVQQLSSAQIVSSRAFASADTAASFAPGTLTIELGQYGTGAPPSFTPKAGATPVTVTIDASTDTLAEVRDKINAANAGVTASIIQDANGARLSLRSTATGAENGFRITAAETVDDGVAATGLSALAYDPSGGTSQLTLNKSAANAKATVNGIAVESKTNTLDGVASGLTITLAQVTSAPVEVGVASNTTAIKAQIQDFVQAYNDLANFIRNQTQYDPASKKGGPLQGDGLVTTLQRQMRNVLNQPSSASSVFGHLSDIGLALKADGTLEVKAGALDNGLAKLSDLQKLMATEGTGNADSGFMQRFQDLGDALLGSGGLFEARNGSLQRSLKANSRRQDDLQQRLDATQKRLLNQYNALDRNMGALNGLSSYVSQQMQALNNFYNRNR
jgi:flagellar hook-associated protein 2